MVAGAAEHQHGRRQRRELKNKNPGAYNIYMPNANHSFACGQ